MKFKEWLLTEQYNNIIVDEDGDGEEEWITISSKDDSVFLSYLKTIQGYKLNDVEVFDGVDKSVFPKAISYNNLGPTLSMLDQAIGNIMRIA